MELDGKYQVEISGPDFCVTASEDDVGLALSCALVMANHQIPQIRLITAEVANYVDEALPNHYQDGRLTSYDAMIDASHLFVSACDAFFKGNSEHTPSVGGSSE